MRKSEEKNRRQTMFKLAIFAVTIVGMLAFGLWAADNPAGVPATQPTTAPTGKPVIPASIKALDGVCNLTADQATQAIKLTDDFQKVVAEFKAANSDKAKELRQAILDAKKKADAAVEAKAKADLQALYAPMEQTAKDYSSSLMAMLTPDQKAKWDEFRAIQAIKGIYGPAKLTDKQIDQVKAARKKIIADGAAGFDQIMIALVGKMSDILTPEQQAIMAKAKRPGPFGTKIF
jgi:Spy/CpxP family protein refolding chaperone